MGSAHHHIKDRVREWAVEPAGEPQPHDWTLESTRLPCASFSPHSPHKMRTCSLLLVGSRALITLTTRGSSDEGSGLIQRCIWADGLLPCQLGVVSEKEEWVTIIRLTFSQRHALSTALGKWVHHTELWLPYLSLMIRIQTSHWCCLSEMLWQLPSYWKEINIIAYYSVDPGPSLGITTITIMLAAIVVIRGIIVRFFPSFLSVRSKFRSAGDWAWRLL